jgi:hypothetical protein
MNNHKVYLKDNMIFVAPGRGDKKYDVYDKKLKYITSFGSRNYAHFKDTIGAYANMNHGDKKRRDRYYNRHKNDYNVYPHSSYFSNVYLWPLD